MQRNVRSWVEGFVELTRNLPSPDIIRRWGAICAVAGALERKVWVRTMSTQFYPSLYCFFIAPPAVGKTVITNRVNFFWKTLREHHVAPTSLTKASFIDALYEAERTILRTKETPPVIKFNSLLLCLNELGVFLPQYDGEFMETLTDIWDCAHYSERRRGNGKKEPLVIPAPQVNMLAATTPAKLKLLLPDGAWDMGFMSRVIMVYASEVIDVDLFDEPATNTDLQTRLIRDLQEIGNIYGEYSWTDGAKAKIRRWKSGGCEPVPDHPKLINYNSRRPAHLLKLCMVAAAERSDELTITEDHVVTALDWLISAEASVPSIFKAMVSGGDSAVIQETFHFIFTQYARRKQVAVPETFVTAFLAERVDSMRVEIIKQTMERAGMVRKEIGPTGQPSYVPLQKSVM